MKTFVEWLSKLAENNPQAADQVAQWQALRQQAGWEGQARANLGGNAQTDDPGNARGMFYQGSPNRVPSRPLGPVNRVRTSPQPGGAPQASAPSYMDFMKKKMAKQ